jgi:hypothetical protein
MTAMLLAALIGAAAISCVFLPVLDVLNGLGLAILAGNIFILGYAGFYALQNRA